MFTKVFFYFLSRILTFLYVLYPRDATRKCGTCYGNVAGWVARWM